MMLAPPVVRALEPTKSVFQYNVHNWGRPDGLPGNKVNTITQTADGYLWLGTQNGLVQFDGIEFRALPIGLPQLRGQDVRALSASPSGGLWFALEEGGFGFFDGKSFSALPDPRWSAPDSAARAVLVGQDGTVWTGSDRELGRWRPGQPESSSTDPTVNRILTLGEGAEGRIWIGTQNESLQVWASGRVSRLDDPAFANHVINSLAIDRKGRVWMATEHGVLRYDPATGEKWTESSRHPANAVLIDQHDIAWIGTAHGLVRVKADEVSVLQKVDGFGSDYVTALFEDREGSLWVGTQDGLSQLSDVKFPIFTAKEGMIEGGSLTVSAAREGGVWITTTSGISRFDGRKFTNYATPSPLSNPYIKLGFETRSGDFYWVDGDRNISVLRDGKRVARYPNAEWTEALTEDEQGVVAGIGPALFRVTPAGLQPFTYKNDRTPDLRWFDNLWTARDGAIWVACYNGIFRVKDGEFRQWSTADGLSGNRVHSVFEDEDGSIWAALSSGLARIRGNELRNVTEANGLFDNRTYAIVPDRHGYFWVNSGRGIFRVSRQGLNDFASGKASRVQCEPFDGQESVKFSDRLDQEFSGCRSTDGRIWFPSPAGVVMIDPANFVVNRVPPPVHIRRVRVGEADLAFTPGAQLELPGERVEIFFTALSYISPRRVQVRYQLEGFDPGWVDAGARRSVQYNLKPGRYVFRVQAANVDGVWNTTGDSIAIELPPPFYATAWFLVVCALGASAGLVLAFRWKVRHLRAAEQRLREENDRLEAGIAARTHELAQSVALLHATLESVTDGIVAVDHAGRLVTCNSSFASICRIPPDMLAAGDVTQLRQHVADQLRDPAAYLRRIAEGEANPDASSYDVFELKDGRTLERYSAPQRVNGRNEGLVVNWRDITERKRSEAAAAEASGVLDALLTHTIDFVYFKDRESRFVRYSRALLSHFHLTDPDALRGKTDFDCYPVARAQSAFDDEQRIIRTGEPVVGKVETTRLADGRASWLLTTKMPWRNERGEIVGTFGVSHDITAIKAFEAELEHERDLLRALMDSSPDKIYFKDLQSRFLRASKALVESVHAAKPEDLIGKTDSDYFTAEHAGPAYADEQEIIRTGQPLIGRIEKETWNDGRETWALTSKMPLRDKAGNVIGTVGISKDITDLKEAESKLEQLHRQLLETSREAGMAEVATSVLHNVGNVLNSVNVSTGMVISQVRESKAGNIAKISAMLQEHASDLAAFLTSDPKGQKIPGYIALLSEQLASERNALTEELEHLRKSIEHIKDIVSVQQNYAKICGVTELVPLTEVVEDALRINAGALSRHGIQVVREYLVQPVLKTERHKVMQIVVNLIRNAKYACDDSGRTEKQLTLRILQEDARVKIMVIDNGIGIPAENLTRIFSHGFTTRKDGHGFGLHSGSLTARELGGSLTVQSDGPGCGATFVLELPLPAPTRSAAAL
jgi:PAS domain S-box-containing protein